MKLLYCQNCNDMQSLVLNETRYCSCHLSKGKYINDLKAIYSGEHAVPIGILNTKLWRAIEEQPLSGYSKPFNSFVFSKLHDNFIKVEWDLFD